MQLAVFVKKMLEKCNQSGQSLWLNHLYKEIDIPTSVSVIIG